MCSCQSFAENQTSNDYPVVPQNKLVVQNGVSFDLVTSQTCSGFMETDLSNFRSELSRIALEISQQLDRLQSEKIVFAESCTAGMIAATMGGVPGISRYLCGSAVTYREATKTDWLGLSPEKIKGHTAESTQVAQDMAELVLQGTPEATLALAITGHLGPEVDDAIDGTVFVAVFQRGSLEMKMIDNRQCRLKTLGRLERQLESTLLALRCLSDNLQRISPERPA